MAAGFGRAKAGDRSRDPRPGVSKYQLIQLISTNGRRNEVSILALPSWTFLLRGPSERLPLYGQRTGGGLSSDDRLDRRAAAGLSEGKLTIKLHGAKRMAGGSWVIRARICERRDFTRRGYSVRSVGCGGPSDSSPLRANSCSRGGPGRKW